MNCRIIALSLFFVALVMGCQEKSEYEKLVETELAKDVRHDSLFMGYELGMARQDFYDHSWSLNRKGLVMQGPQNQTVEYELDDNELPFEATMNFYPDFYNDKIYRMRVYFKYNGWAPWNKRLFSDSLQIDVVNLLEDWYGNGFIRVEDNKNSPRYIKVDGNRSIVVSRLNDMKVTAFITDLKAEKKMENEQNL